jgi:hypothetical protein
MFYSAQLNIFQFINVLQKVHKETYIRQGRIRIIKNRRMMLCGKEDYLRQNIAIYENSQLIHFNYN